MKHAITESVFVCFVFLLCVSVVFGHEGDHGAEPHNGGSVTESTMSEKVINAIVNAHPPGSSKKALEGYIKRDGEHDTFKAFKNYIEADVENNEGPYLLSRSGVNALHIVGEHFGHISYVAEYLVDVAQEYDKYSKLNNVKNPKSLTPLIIWYVGQNDNQGVEGVIQMLHSDICDDYDSKRAVYDTLAHRFSNNIARDEASLLFSYILLHEDDNELVKEVNEYDNFKEIREASFEIRKTSKWESYLLKRGESIQPNESEKVSGLGVSSDSAYSNLSILDYLLISLFLVGVAAIFFTLKAKCRA